MAHKFLTIALMFAGILAATSVACSQMFPSGTWRYRMTVAVETPEGLKTGSAVREVTVRRGIALTPESLPSVQSKGEAVAVDLGQRGVLFALISYDDYLTVFSAFGWTSGGTTPDGIKYFSNLKDAKATLTPKQYPMLVTFKDISDPKTVERVIETDWCREKDENGTCIKEEFFVKADHFEELFGRGVKLKEITIEMVNDPVTWGIQNKLPWLSQYYGQMFDGQRFNTINSTLPLANSLSAGAFSTRRDE
ncbi:MAG: hypothetical protein IPK66_06190 [Rhodospirillales bacterium]|nr:hypothetical protein [Rhodospirillales bacterium]